jgi:ABC-type uncharacterized transport system involved in gliding motility auxiliary subunit
VERNPVRTTDIFGILSVVVVVASAIIYFTLKNLLSYAAIGGLLGMVCLLIYVAVSFERLSGFFSRSSTKYGLNLLITVVVVFAIIGLVEVIASRHNKRFDLTLEKIHSLSPLTKKVVQALEREVKVIVFYKRDQVFEFRDLLKKFKDETDNISCQFYDLEQNPGRAKEYGVSSYGATVVEFQGKRRSFSYCTEENITNGIITVTRKEDKIVYFLKGHGERDPASLDQREGYGDASYALETESYKVKSLLLLREKGIPEDASVLIVSGPKEELLPDERDALSRYLMSGGRAFFMIDPFTVPTLVEYLKRYHILVGENMVVDKENKLVAVDIFSPVVPFYRKDHPITQDFEVATVFPLVCSVEPLEPPNDEKVVATSLAQTSPESWAESNRESIRSGKVFFQEWEDKNGPISVVTVAEVYGASKTPEEKETQREGGENGLMGRVAVCGDSDFASNLYINLLGNKDFFLNIVNWLAEEKELISMRHRKEETYPFSPLFLTKNQEKMILWFSYGIHPLIVLSIGIFIYVRRKMRG